MSMQYLGQDLLCANSWWRWRTGHRERRFEEWCTLSHVSAGSVTTGRTLKTRLTEHKRAVRNKDTNNGIAFVMMTNYSIQWDKAKVLTMEPHWTKRKVKKALEISNQHEPEQGTSTGQCVITFHGVTHFPPHILCFVITISVCHSCIHQQSTQYSLYSHLPVGDT